MMEISRRQCLTLLGSSLLLPSLAIAQQATYQLASAASDNQGNHWLILCSIDGIAQKKIPLVERAHQVISHPSKPWVMAISRRPGKQILVADLQSGNVVARINAAANRHFFGHAVLSDDGRWLFSTENDISSGNGRIVVRDCESSFNIVADIASFGIGPHEMVWAQDKKTLIIANGGIKTHPNSGRKKLNLDTMLANLSYVDSQTGQLTDQVTLSHELHQLSIRHIDCNTQDQVAIAMQYQGALSDDVPLVALHQQGKDLQLLEQPESVRIKMKQYCGSVRFDNSGQVLAVSSPRGDLINFWNQKGDYITSTRVVDGCGITPAERDGEFIISSGRGNCYRYDIASRQKTRLDTPLKALFWDNHLTWLS